ncbi:heat shock protein beta-1-like [Saccostrea cucullata]|uniref:heat shock protein beta-1-like n=1 Tax=Saccostrea cuccullata TaxID=36930 RepID=UPI002ED52451
MDFMPISMYRPGGYQQATPFRDLLSYMLHDELGMPVGYQQPRRREAPEKWHKSFRMDGYHPDEVKVAVQDGTVQINARHERGDEDNRDVRESRRTLRIPQGVDQSKLHCFMDHDNHYVVEAPFLPREEEREVEVKVQDVPAITQGKDEEMQVAETGQAFKENLDLSVFEPDHINVKRKGNVISVSADHDREEDGIRVRRSFCREFTVPEDMDCSQVQVCRDPQGHLTIMAPPREEEEEK